MHVEPSECNGRAMRPCTLVLKDGRQIDRVICMEEARPFHEGDWVHPAEIQGLAESPYRLPARLAEKLYDFGESGPGYYAFTIDLTNGNSFACTTGPIVDFPYLPQGVTCRDIADVQPHTGNPRSGKTSGKRSADFSFCYYVPYI